MKKVVSVSMRNVMKFCQFCEDYQIEIYLSWQHEDFLSVTLRAVVSTKATAAISEEEKERLILESGFITIINPENV